MWFDYRHFRVLVQWGVGDLKLLQIIVKVTQPIVYKHSCTNNIIFKLSIYAADPQRAVFMFSTCIKRHVAMIVGLLSSRVTLYTAGHLHTAVPHCSHSRAPIVHTAVPRENNEHGCVYLRCTAVCKLPGCVEGHPWRWSLSLTLLWHHNERDDVSNHQTHHCLLKRLFRRISK